MRRVAAVAAGVVLFVVGFASPASADHTGGVTADGSTCYIGELASHIGVAQRTDDLHITRNQDGVITGYVCRFDGLPEESTFEENGWFDYTAPTRALRVEGRICEDPDNPGTRYTDDGVWIILPNLRGILRCKF